MLRGDRHLEQKDEGNGSSLPDAGGKNEAQSKAGQCSVCVWQLCIESPKGEGTSRDRGISCWARKPEGREEGKAMLKGTSGLQGPHVRRRCRKPPAGLRTAQTKARKAQSRERRKDGSWKARLALSGSWLSPLSVHSQVGLLMSLS